MSKFGKGLTYCLGLFLAHAEREWSIKDSYQWEMWFNAAADHLYELQTPTELPKNIRLRLKKLQDKSLHWRLAMGKDVATEKDKLWAIEEAKNILFAIDKFYKISVEKADWN